MKFYLVGEDVKGELARGRWAELQRPFKEIPSRINQYVWVKLDPPIDSSKIGIPGPDIVDAVLTPSMWGQKILGANLPVGVFLSRFKNSAPLETGIVKKGDLETLSRAELYESEEQADRYKIPG